MKPNLKCLSNPSPPRPSRLLDAAGIIVHHLGLKAIPVPHLSEKLSGERPITWRDIEQIAASIPPEWPHLRELFISALLGWECVSLSRLGADSSESIPPRSPASLSLRKAA